MLLRNWLQRIGATVLGVSFLALQGYADPREDWNSSAEFMNLPCHVDGAPFKYQAEAGFDLHNSYIAMLSSWLIHLKPENIQKQLHAWGFEDASLLGWDKAGPTAMVTHKAGWLLVAFRGTVSLEDYRHNALFAQTSLEALGFPGRGHLGMFRKYRDLKPEVIKEVIRRRQGDERIIVVGHSLGGVMGMLTSLDLKKLGMDVDILHTFGQPHFGNDIFNEFASRELADRYFRVEDELDIVPHVPPLKASADAFSKILPKVKADVRGKMEKTLEILDYYPSSGEMRTMAKGDIDSSANPEETSLDEGYWLKIVEELGTRQTNSDWLNLVIAHFAEHHPLRYICKLQKLASR